MLCCIEESGTDWSTVFASVGSVFVAIAALVISYLQFNKTLKNSNSKDERDEIYKKLNEFYGPLIQLRKKSYNIYQIYKVEYVKEDPEFSTLTYLLKGNKFKGNGDVLIREIISIGRQCEKLIQSKAGLIDDHYLTSDLLPKAITHYRILYLAYHGFLKGEQEKYKQYTFPHELDAYLEKRKSELIGRLSKLNG
jgi:hypothetical protein